MKKHSGPPRLWRTLFIILMGFFLVGCSAGEWSPTDPRSNDPSMDGYVVEDSWDLGVGVDVKTSDVR